MALLSSFEKPKFSSSIMAQRLIDTHGKYSKGFDKLQNELEIAMSAIRSQDMNNAKKVIYHISLNFCNDTPSAISEYIFKELNRFYRIEADELKWEQIQNELYRRSEQERALKEQKERCKQERKTKFNSFILKVKTAFKNKLIPILAIGLSIIVVWFIIFQINDSSVVYITSTGECYHRSNCRYLHSSKYEISLESAVAKGYRRCSVCKPPNPKEK